MGIDVNYEPRTRSKNVGPSDHDILKLERFRKGKSASGYYQLNILNGEFKELRLVNSPSPHRKSMPSRLVVDNVEKTAVKRGSVYQSSREMQSTRKVREGNRKTESSFSDEAFMSFKVLDSSSRPCRSDAILLDKQNRSPLVSLNTELKNPDLDSIHSAPIKSRDFLDLSFRHLPEEYPNLGSSFSSRTSARDSFADSLLETPLHSGCNYDRAAPELLRIDLVKEPNGCSQMLCPESSGNVLHVRDTRNSLPKSFSAKIRPSHSTCQPEIGNLKSSPKSRFSPLKKMLDPIMKSKSLRSPLILEGGKLEHTITVPANIRIDREFQKGLLDDFSNATLKKVDAEELIGKEKASVFGSSPAHLHGTLRLDFKHDVPSFEFAVKDPEDVISAKTWKTDNTFSWVYTFHSYKKKIGNSGWGTRDKHRPPPPMVGQMNVSCYLCSEVSDHGSLENSMVTEFNLYDIDHARRSFSMEERAICSLDCTQAPDVSTTEDSSTSTHPEVTGSAELEKSKLPVKHASRDSNSDPSACYPWAPADLVPHFETAAVAVQIPFNKKGCLKDLQVGEGAMKGYTSLSSASTCGTKTSNNLNGAHVKVVIPSGTHGLPSTEDVGPSSLLDKWRSGGGCDCGGWDMGCPIVVFDNICQEDLANHNTIGNQQLMVLFVQGKKEKIPALSIVPDEKGQYSVEFHAQLSAIQAFAICIAILHSSEASSVIDQEKNKQRLHSNSLKLLLEEEVKHLIEAVAKQEESRKPKKKVEKTPLSFILDPPPFSPMGRV